MKRILIVSPHFPPVNAPDMQRVRMSLPFYRENGWEPVVLTVRPGAVEGVREPELLDTLPPDVRVEQTGALPVAWTRWLGLRNLGLRSWFHLFARGAALLRRERFDLVLFSNTQFITFTLGPLWRACFGVRYVIDLQDPWRTDYYERPGARQAPGGWKYQLARFFAWALEGWTYRRMSAMMSVSEDYLRELCARYPWFARIPSEVIRFGASEADFQRLRVQPAHCKSFHWRQDRLRILYTGAAGPIMPHALNVLFGGLKRFRQLQPAEAEKLHFYFIGTSYVAPGRGVPSVMPVARMWGVDDLIEEMPHRIGHLESLQLQIECDVLIILGSSDLAYSPSKLYPYFLSGKPMMSLIFYSSYLEKILRELNCSVLICFHEDQPKDAAYAALMGFFQSALNGFPAGTLPVRNAALFREHFLAETLTAAQCALFARALATAAPSPSVAPSHA